MKPDLLRRDSVSRNIPVMYAIALLQGMVFYGPIATLYRQVRGISVFQITLIEGISLALCLILEVPWGILADRIGYRKTLVLCSWLYFISKIIFWQAADFAGFLLERVILSIVFAGLSGVDTSILYLSNQGRDMQKIYGRYNAFGMLGLLIASGIFSLLIRDHYALAGLLTVVSYGVAALLSFFLVEVHSSESQRTEPETFRATLRGVIRSKKLLFFLAAVALLSEAHQTITVFLNQLQYERCGLGSSAIGILYSVATVLGLLSFCSAAVTKRLGIRRSLMLFSLLPFFSSLTLGLVHTALPSIGAIFLLRISDTLFQPLQQELQNRQIHTDQRATALSIHSMLISCVGIGTNLLFGFLSDWNLSHAFFFGAVISLTSLAGFAVWSKGR